MKKLTRITAAAAFCATSLLAQQSQSQPGEAPKLVDTIDIRIINLDVVVTDRKGNPIQGLKKEDFEIYENGVLKPVSNFYEIEKSRPVIATAVQTLPSPLTPAAVTPAPAPAKQEDIPENLRRRIIFFIDNLSLAPFNRNKVFTQMKEFARTTMRPGDEAMVATFNRSMKVRVPFTRDAKQIEQTLDIIAGESALGLSNRSERKSVEERIKDATSQDDAVASARAYAASVEHDLRQSVESLNALMSTLAGVEGKKILVLTSEGFPIQPGKEVFYYIDEVAREKQGWQGRGSSMLESMTFDSTRLIQSVARTANANGITMYPIHAGGLDAGNEMSAENARPTSFTISQAVVSNSTDSLQMMAEMTGGLASILTNNFKGAFDRIRSDLDAYYSLGYRAGTERVDRQRSLEVRVRNRNYVVRSRQTFVEKSTFAEMNDRVIANLLYKTKANDLNVRVILAVPQPTDDGLFRVPVDIQIPMDSLTFLPMGEELYAGGFDVYVAVANKDNDMSDVNRKMQQIRVSAADYKTIKGKYYTYTLQLLMEPGVNRVSIGVVDQISNTSGFALQQVIARDLR